VLSACGAAGPVALHLAALWPGRFAAVVLRDAPASYAALLETEDFIWPHDVVLPGVLRHYDLPDLIAAAGCPVYEFNARGGARGVVGAEGETAEEVWIGRLRTLLYGAPET
jgi:pimeloyl-ACP methyl ester carboxylesterase